MKYTDYIESILNQSKITTTRFVIAQDKNSDVMIRFRFEPSIELITQIESALCPLPVTVRSVWDSPEIFIERLQ